MYILGGMLCGLRHWWVLTNVDSGLESKFWPGILKCPLAKTDQVYFECLSVAEFHSDICSRHSSGMSLVTRFIYWGLYYPYLSRLESPLYPGVPVSFCVVFRKPGQSVSSRRKEHCSGEIYGIHSLTNTVSETPFRKRSGIRFF